MHFTTNRTRTALGAWLTGVLLLGVLQPAGHVSASNRGMAPVPLSDCFSSDHGMPTLTGLTLSETTVDVRRQEQTVWVTGTAEDTGGPGPALGIDDFNVTVGEAGEDHADWLAGVALRPGTDGVWRGKLTIPRGDGRSDWPITVYLDDRDDQHPDYPNYSFFGTGWLRVHGMSHQLKVRTVDDVQAPRLRALRIRPRTVHDGSAGGVIRVRARLTDNAAGVREAFLALGRGGATGVNLRLVQGTPLDGIWAGRLSTAALHANKLWPARLWLQDRTMDEFENNSRGYSTSALAAAGFPSSVHVRAGADIRPPRISDLQVSSRDVDVRTGDATVTIQARIRDGGSGVQGAYAALSTSQIDWNYTSRLTRVAGTEKDGIWAGEVVVDHCTARSRPFVASVHATDFAEWNARLRDQDHPVAVTAGDNIQPRLKECPTYPPGVRSLCFTEDVTGINGETAIIRKGDPPTLVSGTWSCQDSTGAAADCETGRVRVARFTPMSTTASGLTVSLNPEHTLGVTDMAGNPVFTY